MEFIQSGKQLATCFFISGKKKSTSFVECYQPVHLKAINQKEQTKIHYYETHCH